MSGYKLAFNSQSNEAKNSKYGHRVDKKSSTSRTTGRLQMVLKSHNFRHGERKTLNSIHNVLKILIQAQGVW